MPYGASEKERRADDTGIDGAGNGSYSKSIQMTESRISFFPFPEFESPLVSVYSSSNEDIAPKEILADNIATEREKECDQGTTNDDSTSPLGDELPSEKAPFCEPSPKEIVDHDDGLPNSSWYADNVPTSPRHIDHASFPCERFILLPSVTDPLCQKYRIEPNGEMFPHAIDGVEMETGKDVILNFFPEPQLLQQTMQIMNVLSDKKHVFRLLQPDVLQFEGYPPALVSRKGSITLEQWSLEPNHYLTCRAAALNQIFRMVQELHDAEIVVANLSPQMIAWCSEDHFWKLISVHGAACVKENLPFGCCSYYAAPEVIRAREDGDMSIIRKPADMWSLGILTLELFLGKEHCERGGQPERLRQYIQEELPTLTNDEDEREALDELLRNLLCLEPNERLTIEQALKSRFFTKYIPDSRSVSVSKTTSTEGSFKTSTPYHTFSSITRLEVAVKRFQSSDDPKLPLRDRRTRSACIVNDEHLPTGHAHIIRKSEKALLEISLEYDIPLDIEKLEDVKISAEDEEPVDVCVETVESHRTRFKAIAELDPADFKNGILSKRSSCFGQTHRKYVRLHIDFNMMRNGSQESFRQGGSFYIKVVGLKSCLFVNTIENCIRNSNKALPPWMRSVGKGCIWWAQCIPLA